jgi:hypothetical protein
VLCAGTSILWWRCKAGIDDVFDLSSRRSALWELRSAQGCLVVSHVENWPGPYDCSHNSSDQPPVPGSGVPIFLPSSGAWSKTTTAHWVSFQRGAYVTPLMRGGQAWMMAYFTDRVVSMPRSAPLPFWSVSVPHAFAALVLGWPLLWLAAAALLAFWRYLIRQRRLQRACCLSCGYKLTGNTSGRCPECGWKFSIAISLADGLHTESTPYS